MNNGIFNGSTQAEFGGSDEISIRKEIADRLRSGIEATKRNLKGERNLSAQEQADAENCIALDYAKEKNLWIDDLYSLGKPTGVNGNENTLALDDKNLVLYKSNNLFNSKNLISNLLEQIRIHNQLFSETKYEVVGFTGIDNGKNRPPYIEVILKQDFVYDVINASPQEISDYMQSLGFKPISEHAFTNGQYTISDLHPRNVLKDENGTIYVVDDIVSENDNIQWTILP